MRTFAVVLGLVVLSACSKSSPTPTPPDASGDPVSDSAGEEEQPVDGSSVNRPELTSADCEAEGGTVVGDIGDGAIHQPDYVCPDSGAAPIGSIVAEPGGAVAVEGAVCCK